MFFMMLAVVGLWACGSKPGGESAGGDTASAPAEKPESGKWPSAMFGKYGIDELKTGGKIVMTQFEGSDDFRYEVWYKGVSREELLAWLNGLKGKGFRMTDMDWNRVEKKDWEHVYLYLPEEGKDRFVELFFNFEGNESTEYYADEPDPAFDIVYKKDDSGDEHAYIEYNLTVTLKPLKNEARYEGAIEALGLKADDFKGIPGIRVVSLSSGSMGASMDVAYYGDHILAEGDMDVMYDKVTDVLGTKGLKFFHALNAGKEYTAEQLKAEKIRSFTIEKDGKQYLMMAMPDVKVGTTGNSVKFMFRNSGK